MYQVVCTRASSFLTLRSFSEIMLLPVSAFCSTDKKENEEKWTGVKKRKEEEEARFAVYYHHDNISIQSPRNAFTHPFPFPSLFLFYFSFSSSLLCLLLSTINYLGISKATPDQGPLAQATHPQHPQDHRQSTCLQLLL